jgi:hypothetical protein
MSEITDTARSTRSWSARRSMLVFFLVGIGGWTLVAALVWCSWRY